MDIKQTQRFLCCMLNRTQILYIGIGVQIMQILLNIFMAKPNKNNIKKSQNYQPKKYKQ